ncbi:DUF4124 domain-containing protein [Thalassolituus sp. LLYu03]|uniref:DUF4124 domain-containing protein n=1 Tax=Thalassolituus sp. LLYu03 TaxID=3421656 RepID=UPI003D28C2E0
MKTKITFMLLILAAACIAPFFIKGPNGQPLMTLPQKDQQLSTEETRQTYYKWQDEKGQWHFGDDVPKDAKTVAVEIDTAANILQSVKMPVAEPVKPKAKAQTTPSAIPGIPMTVNPAEIPKLIEDAKNVQTMVDDRARQLEQTR